MTANFGPCNPWPVRWACDVMTESVAVTGWAVAAATDILWLMSGSRFGTCNVKLRPCRRQCRATSFPGFLWDPWPGVGWGSLPYGGGGGWGVIGAGCSSCGSGCGCSTLSEVLLPSPVASIVEVRTDGAILPTGSYRVDNNSTLVRLDGLTWPYCQNLRLDDTQPGTFSVTAAIGEDVPASAAGAVGELACELIRASRGQACDLPANVTQLVRQGVTVSMPDWTSLLKDKGMLGLRQADLFINAWNPGHLRGRARSYNVDQVAGRRMGT